MAKIKLKLKLPYVMPHAWLHKIKGVRRMGDRLEYNSAHDATAVFSKQASSAPAPLRKGNYTSPVNHKAIDIPFPSDNPTGFPFSEDIAILSPLDPSEVSAAPIWPFLKIGNKINQPPGCITMGSNNGEEDGLHAGFSPAFLSKSGPLISNGPNFDVRELERKLKALESEDRRRYYASPMLSEALPTPIDHVVADGLPHTPLSQNNDNSIHDSEGVGLIARRLPVNGMYENGNHGGDCRFYRSSSIETNSVRRSTSSSSDTGYERGTSSIWEREILSSTSDGSEALMSNLDDGAEAHQGSKRGPLKHHKNPREGVASAQSSPLLYKASFHATNPSKVQNGDMSSKLCIDEGSVYVHKGARRSLFLDSPCHHQKSVTWQGDSHFADVYTGNGNLPDLTDNETTWDGWQTYESIAYRSPSRLSPCHSVTSSHGHVQCMVMDLQDRFDMENQQQGGGKVSPLLESYQLPLGSYKSSEPKKLAHTYNQKSPSVHGDKFSYTGCKERPLLGRTSFEQSLDTGPFREGETDMATMSNYSKFKLKQKLQTYGKVGTRGSSYPELRLYNRCCSAANDCIPVPSDATAMSDSYHQGRVTLDPHYRIFQGTPEQHIRNHSHRSPSSQRPPVLHDSRASPINMNKGLNEESGNPNLYVQGPTWSNKATLSAVRERTGDPSFQSFNARDIAPTGVPLRSGVFDSFAMVKSSYDLKQDFKGSMVEMILEKDLNRCHDMVELLQCYLTLNPPTYHDTIVKAFTEVWSEVFEDAV